MVRLLAALATVLLAAGAIAQPRDSLLAYLERTAPTYNDIALQLWDLAELGYLETNSSALLRDTLADQGFGVTEAVADIPTAFVASYGSGKPVIALLAEFDALPGISQSAAPQRELVAGKNAGQACGHHLFGAGSVAAAVAVKHWMAENKVQGTLRLYGTPAEEGGSGKVYMARAGLFSDVDVVLHWHPSDRNQANPESSLANKSAKFRFRGVSSHAAAAPERGRSALDAVEAMNFMVNQMREHVPQETRMHYVITSGGSAPNVVPDFAEVFYYLRHPSAATLQELWQRLISTAEGAALGTGTDMEFEVIHGNHSLLPNTALAEAMHANLSRLGGIRYSAQEQAYAQEIRLSLPDSESLKGLEQQVLPSRPDPRSSSTDVGDVSWQVPTAGLRTATWVPGTSSHTWQAVAAGGTGIGLKGMQLAAKTLSLTAADLFTRPALIEAARQEFEQRRGKDFRYQPLLGDRQPPLDYRVPR